ncbi:MAG: phosphoglycerate mutase family protein [Candidatus Woesebacteria bacterium]|jgi:broad specificity phosphatase PhoE
MNYYIFRHGETYETKNNLEYGPRIEKAEILPVAVPTTKKIARYLSKKEIDKFYSSGYKRCVQTSEIVKEITKMDYTIDERLGEYRSERESFNEFSLRVDDFLLELKKKDFKAVSICTHGAVISALTYKIVGKAYSLNELIDFPRPGVVIEIDRSGIRRVSFRSNNS